MSELTALQIGMTASVRRAGGVDRYYFNLMRAIAGSGVHVNGLVTGHPGAVSSLPNVKVYASERDALPVKWLKMRRVARPLVASSDVVVSHFAPYALPILDKLRHKPFVVHFHGPWALESAAEGGGGLSVAIKRQIEKTVYRAAGRMIVLSPAFADIAVKEYGVPAEVVRVIPGGVDLERFGIALSRTQARRQLGWPQDRPTVATVRRLVHAKGVDNLIKAASLLRERIPNVFIAIVGTGPLADTLQQCIEARGLQDTVRMVGQVSEADLPSVYRAADLFVVPTITLEGFGLVVLEALASGTPAFVTPIGGLPDLLRPLAPSLVLEGFEPEQIARGLGAALSGEMALPDEAACAAYAKHFCWNEIANRIGDVYREAAASFSEAKSRHSQTGNVRAHSY